MLEAGYEIERYVVEGVLGEGGMAVVYMVRHATLGTRHALKVLSVSNKSIRQRLIQEGQLQATLRHPNIVAVTDVIDVAGAPGLLMEYIEGAGLDHWLDYYQPTVDEALTVFKAIVAGVGHAHAQNLIHRDLKPGNVMLHVTEHGVVPKVTDFGLAKATGEGDLKRTRTGTTMGTPAYMAPEQIRDASTVDRRADLYSLGCILYELVCGRTPYEEDDMLELFTMIRSGDYPDPRDFTPELSDPIVDTIRALVTVHPTDRLTDCAAILEMLGGAGPGAHISSGSVESLGPPRPIPPMMITTLPPAGPGAQAARSMVQDVAPVLTGPVSDLSWAGRVNTASQTVPVATGPATSLATSVEASPNKARAAFGVAALLGIAFVVFLLLIVVVLLVAVLADVNGEPTGLVVEQPHVEPAPSPVPAPEPVEPTPVQPVPVQPVAPPPVPVVPVPPKPTRPVPAPVVPAPKPPPVAPKPQPVAPTPPPRPKPKPEPTGGTFSVTTDGVAMAITIQGPSGPIYRPGQDAPPGVYDILINGNRGGGKVTIRAGKKVKLKCFASAARCKAP